MSPPGCSHPPYGGRGNHLEYCKYQHIMVKMAALALAALLQPVAGFLTPSLGKGGLAVRHSATGNGGLAARHPVLGQHLGLRATAEKYSETKKELVRKYRGYLEGTIDTDGEVLPEWRIDNRQVKLEAQGITAETAPKRAGYN